MAQWKNNCTVKEAYNLLVAPNPSSNSGNSKWIRKLKVPPNIQSFLWKLYHKRLPVKAYLPWLFDSICPIICHLEGKTHLHHFQQCSFTEKVRHCANSYSSNTELFNQDWEVWILKNATSLIPAFPNNISWSSNLFLLFRKWLSCSNRSFKGTQDMVSHIL